MASGTPQNRLRGQIAALLRRLLPDDDNVRWEVATVAADEIAARHVGWSRYWPGNDEEADADGWVTRLERQLPNDGEDWHPVFVSAIALPRCDTCRDGTLDTYCPRCSSDPF